MINFSMRVHETAKDITLTGNECVRRILCYSEGTTGVMLFYKGIYIASFNVNNNIDIEFKSYYGFPKISDFTVSVPPNNNVSILVDTLPGTSVAQNYIERRPVV